MRGSPFTITDLFAGILAVLMVAGGIAVQLARGDIPGWLQLGITSVLGYYFIRGVSAAITNGNPNAPKDGTPKGGS